MRYFLIDRITYLERNRKIKAIKNVSLAEDVFTDHFAGFPIMPGALMIESLAQTGTALIEVSSDYKFKAILAFINNAKFRALIRPGDSLVIELEITSEDNRSANTYARILLGDKVVADAEIAFTKHNARDFYPEKFNPLVEALYDVWLRDAELVGF